MSPLRVPGSRWTMVAAALFLLLHAIPAVAVPQQADQPPPPPWKNSDLRMDAALHRAAAIAQSGVAAGEVRSGLRQRGHRLDGEGRVQVEVSAEAGLPPLAPEVLAAFGGRVTATWRGKVEAWVPAGRLADAARALPPGYFMSRPVPPAPADVQGQGPLVAGTIPYGEAGLAGEGLTIAVIDGGWYRFGEARANGDVPPVSRCEEINYSETAFEAYDEDWEEHGTACVEVLHDFAPAARWRAYKFDSDVDFAHAIDDAIAHGVDIISISVSWVNQGWADDTGIPAEVVNAAAASGILVFVSAGNYAEAHWQGMFRPGPDADVWHDWVDGDETAELDVPAGGKGYFALSWNTSGAAADYDLYLYTADGSTLLDSSTERGSTFEYCYWKNDSGSTRKVRLQIARHSGGTAEMEVFAYGDSGVMEHAVAAGSTTSPSNATHPNVVSIGAVGWLDYTSPGGTTGIARWYSSHGPSNSGMLLPDVASPTSVKTYVWPSGFGGTSAAAPNAAGIAAVLWSCAPATDATAVRERMLRWAAYGKDWGDSGPDNIYGRGGVHLPAFRDCNAGGIPDACRIVNGGSTDCDDEGTADDCQTDSDEDGVIDACDRCSDLDRDGYGEPGDPSCRRGESRDCDDANPNLSPGALEICDGVDTDCSGVADDHVCRGFDVDGNGSLDGVELAWLSRAFGLCSATPAAEWWSPVDLDRSACVEGADLAILGSAGVWGRTSATCSYTCP